MFGVSVAYESLISFDRNFLQFAINQVNLLIFELFYHLFSNGNVLVWCVSITFCLVKFILLTRLWSLIIIIGSMHSFVSFFEIEKNHEIGANVCDKNEWHKCHFEIAHNPVFFSGEDYFMLFFLGTTTTILFTKFSN